MFHNHYIVTCYQVWPAQLCLGQPTPDYYSLIRTFHLSEHIFDLRGDRVRISEDPAYQTLFPESMCTSNTKGEYIHTLISPHGCGQLHPIVAIMLELVSMVCVSHLAAACNFIVN